MENRLKCNRKSRIFWKVFIVNIVMLLMIVIIAYLLLYYLLPSFYKNYKIKEFRQLSSELIGQIKDGQKETEALLAFSERYDVDIILKDEQDDIIFDYYRSNTIVTNIDQDKDMPEISVDTEQEKNKPAELSTSYELNNEVRTLFIIIPLEPIDEAKEVVIQIYPYGERLEDKKDLPALYRAFGESFKHLDSWSAYMITSYEEAERYFGRKADKNRKIYNGMLKTYFYQFLGPKPPKKPREK